MDSTLASAGRRVACAGVLLRAGAGGPPGGAWRVCGASSGLVAAALPDRDARGLVGLVVKPPIQSIRPSAVVVFTKLELPRIRETAPESQIALRVPRLRMMLGSAASLRRPA